MPDPITMTGQYACRIAPYDQVRVICVDGPDPARPVVFFSASGALLGADPFGSNGNSDYDLIQLRRKPVEAWALVGPNGGTIAFSGTQGGAGRCMYEFPGSRLVRLVEAEDGQ